jgi:hypothetical protein
MIDGAIESHGEAGALTKHLHIRVLNCSAGGCLLESDVPVKVGTVGILRISVGARTFCDTVEVTRCQAIAGGRGTHHVGARLLPTPGANRQGSLRHVTSLDRATLAGWLTTGRPH